MRITQKKLQKIIREEVARNQHNRQLLEEGLWDILKSFGKGAIETIKEAVARKILEVLDLDVDSTVAHIFINFIGNLELGDIKDMLMGEHKCITASREFTEALIETLIEEIPRALDLAPKGVFTGALQETLVTAMTGDFSQKLAEALCDIDYGPIIEELPGGSIISKFLD